jgi:hypothetical protein
MRVLAKKKKLKGLIVFAFLLFLSQKAFSVNTVETYNPQSGYFSIDFGISEMQPKLNASKVNSKVVLGKGLNPFISAYMGMQLQGTRYLSYGWSGLFMGAISKLYSHNNFSFDLTLEAGLFSEMFYSAPGIEINFDLAPDQQFMGFYLDLIENISGADIDDSLRIYRFTPETELNIGYYISLVEGQQLHIRFDQRFRHKPAFGERRYEIDALRLGYNMMMNDGFQIQTELEYQIPMKREKNRYGFRVGLVKW